MKNKRRTAKRAGEVGTGVVIVLGLGAGVLGVALYNHFKAPVAVPPLVPGLNPTVQPPTTDASSVLGLR